MSVQNIFVGTCLKNAEIPLLLGQTIQIDFISGDSEQPGAGFQFSYRQHDGKSIIKLFGAE